MSRRTHCKECKRLGYTLPSLPSVPEHPDLPDVRFGCQLGVVFVNGKMKRYPVSDAGE